MQKISNYSIGIVLSCGIAMFAYLINRCLPSGFLGETLVALLLGMCLNPIICKYDVFTSGVNWTSKYILRSGIVIAGIALSFSQVIQAGKYALILMFFTLSTAFTVGFSIKRANINAKSFFKYSVKSVLKSSFLLCTWKNTETGYFQYSLG